MEDVGIVSFYNPIVQAIGMSSFEPNSNDHPVTPVSRDRLGLEPYTCVWKMPKEGRRVTDRKKKSDVPTWAQVSLYNRRRLGGEK